MPKRAISIKLQSNLNEITLRHRRFPVNLLHIFRTPFPKNSSRGMLLVELFITLNGLFQHINYRECIFV